MPAVPPPKVAPSPPCHICFEGEHFELTPAEGAYILEQAAACGASKALVARCEKDGAAHLDITYYRERPRFERIRRITGYLVGTLERFNDAKKAEERDRVKHDFEGKEKRRLADLSGKRREVAEEKEAIKEAGIDRKCCKCGATFEELNLKQSFEQGFTKLGGKWWCSSCASKRFKRVADPDALLGDRTVAHEIPDFRRNRK